MDTDDDKKDDFYKILLKVIDGIPRHDIKLLTGDFNPQIDKFRKGTESTIDRHRSANITNDNGERFTLFCSLNYISINNAFFKHKGIHKTTWLSTDHHTKNEIDYISISSRWRSSLQDIRVYRGADCGSDHFLLIAKMRLKFKRLKQAEKQMIFDFAKLKDTSTRLRYQLEVRNRFAFLEETNDIEVRWSSF